MIGAASIDEHPIRELRLRLEQACHVPNTKMASGRHLIPLYLPNRITDSEISKNLVNEVENYL